VQLIPEATDEDIDWVASRMGLTEVDAPRRAFLASRCTQDVAACPGSGKTTLIVAKLAVLARKWPHRTKGVCVLSHTNVAREEIQHRLGDMVIGQRILTYPHFIDTIHGFVNRFLALPWLHSNGYPSPTIDDAVAVSYRRSVLSNSEYWTLENFLRKKHSSFEKLRITSCDFRFDLSGKAFPAGPDSKSFKLASRAVEMSARAGYFCYDELFIWARQLLDGYPALPSWLASRFPLVIVDEMQDTSDLQGAILAAVFPRDRPDVVVQRLGDPNQAIFDSSEQAGVCHEDPFPDPAARRCLSIPNSHRFGPEIAALASPFAVTPVSEDGLRGIGPRKARDVASRCRHAIFVFPDEKTSGVLDAFGKHALASIPDSCLAGGVVCAVGAVHQDESDTKPGQPQYPKTVPHYWSGYTADIARREPHPKSLVQYIRAAQDAVRRSGEFAPGVERIASGIVRLAGLIGDVEHLKGRQRSHRAIVEAATRDPEALEAYRALVQAYLFDQAPLVETAWVGTSSRLLAVSKALCSGATDVGKAESLLRWPSEAPALAIDPAEPGNAAGPNAVRIVVGDRHVDIHLGSIHSVKGQTHVATMVLNTHWYKHAFECMLPWLLGAKCNQSTAGSRDVERLRQSYVAMTRPTHLLCLAIPRSILGDAGSYLARAEELARRGWRVGDVVDGAAVWQG
jgi:DNA helicase-2/ATP-dependent DNA helicase PcrA